MPVVKNLWGITKFYCGHGHEIPIEMVFKDGPSSMFYSCPRYYVDRINRPGERACANRLNFVDAENIVTLISDKIIESEKNGEQINLKNYEFDYRNKVHVKVLDYSVDEMKLEIVNRKALRWRQ